MRRRKADDEASYEWFFRDEFPRVVRTVYLIVHDRQTAEDIAQEAFARLLVHWSKVSRYEQPDAWVRRIAIRMAARANKRAFMRARLEARTERPEQHGPEDVDLMRGGGAPCSAAGGGRPLLLRGPADGCDRRDARMLGVDCAGTPP